MPFRLVGRVKAPWSIYQKMRQENKSLDQVMDVFGFRLVVRGYDPRHEGVAMGQHSATIDGGCGFGGTLVAACFGANGEFLQMIEA